MLWLYPVSVVSIDTELECSEKGYEEEAGIEEGEGGRDGGLLSIPLSY